MNLSLIDRMLLLASTDEGRHALRDLPTLVAGAALADLAGRGRLDSPGRAVVVIDPTPTGHPVLDDLLSSVKAIRRPRPAWRWVFDSARGVTRAEREYLAGRRVLRREDDVVLGMLPRTRYPITDHAARQEVVGRVRGFVLNPPGADEAAGTQDETPMLVALLGTAYHSRRTAEALFPELDARTLRTRLRTPGSAHWAVTGTAHAIRLANAARA